jgi:hypothetical protein
MSDLTLDSVDLSSVSLDSVPLERLEAQITEWSGHIAAATAQLLEWIAEYDRREGWASWACKSAAHWMSWKCGDTLHTAREKVRVARALEELPAIAAAFRHGEVSYSKVRAITRVALATDDGEWLDIARRTSGSELERIVAETRKALDRNENDDASNAFALRRLSRSSCGGAVDKIVIKLPSDAGAEVLAALDVIASQLIDDAVAGSGRTRRDIVAERGGIEAIRVDAFVQMAERVLAMEPAAAERGDIGRLQLNIDTDGINELAAGDSVPGELTLEGRRVAPEVAKRWACDIRASVMLEHDGHPHDSGRDTRTINRRLRRALHRRDHGTCRFPGCAASSWLHAHHVNYWDNGGETRLDNLVSLCSFHHHQVHEGGWTIEILESTTIAWTDPHGQPATIEPLNGNTTPIETCGRQHGVDQRSIESQWHNDHLDFGFVISVIIEHSLNQQQQNVPAGTP